MEIRYYWVDPRATEYGEKKKGQLKIFKNDTGNRTWNLPSCGAVCQPTVPLPLYSRTPQQLSMTAMWTLALIFDITDITWAIQHWLSFYHVKEEKVKVVGLWNFHSMYKY